MIIEYQNGCMFIEHDSGQLDSYTIQELNEFKDNLIDRKTKQEQLITKIQNFIDLATSSLPI